MTLQDPYLAKLTIGSMSTTVFSIFQFKPCFRIHSSRFHHVKTQRRNVITRRYSSYPGQKVIKELPRSEKTLHFEVQPSKHQTLKRELTDILTLDIFRRVVDHLCLASLMSGWIASHGDQGRLRAFQRATSLSEVKPSCSGNQRKTPPPLPSPSPCRSPACALDGRYLLSRCLCSTRKTLDPALVVHPVIVHK